ncbi:hypothetical protein THAOC_32755 [Thalassiosira oceanica]|uniref:MYND-type domain-containing protein n=1 Tax=Thalassiosira oceanica TaxID=159749 RepID=K0R8H6_THAOC|nr:hypothetical protein THAOC_32755 [Thalassiosira oceanica]|eukprot:EJK48444.1 hypothetical protein THAOC_32755 [Thalassiosira oceanica]
MTLARSIAARPRPARPRPPPRQSSSPRGTGRAGPDWGQVSPPAPTKSPIGFQLISGVSHKQKGEDQRTAKAKATATSTCDRSEARREGRTTHSSGHQPFSKGTSTSNMSCVPVADVVDDTCANCGKQGSDTVKLKNCTACRLVKYCGVDCQRAHRKQHKTACKQRAAELQDEQLYSHGRERQEGDFCPLCALPIPLPKEDHSFFRACCTKTICRGCSLAAKKRGMFDCAFCRAPCPDNDADQLAMIRARVKKKDPEAIYNLGTKYCHGELGLQKDMQMAVELWTEASELGSIEAIFNLGNAYFNGDGVQQDEGKAYELYKKAAMQGHVVGRHGLGNHEARKGKYDRAVRHWRISAKMGDEISVENIKKLFMAGVGTKEQYVEALRGYQNAVEEMKSHDRDEAKSLGY